jgi:hypothetical protein
MALRVRHVGKVCGCVAGIGSVGWAVLGGVIRDIGPRVALAVVSTDLVIVIAACPSEQRGKGPRQSSVARALRREGRQKRRPW